MSNFSNPKTQSWEPAQTGQSQLWPAIVFQGGGFLRKKEGWGTFCFSTAIQGGVHLRSARVASLVYPGSGRGTWPGGAGRANETSKFPSEGYARGGHTSTQHQVWGLAGGHRRALIRGEGDPNNFLKHHHLSTRKGAQVAWRGCGFSPSTAAGGGSRSEFRKKGRMVGPLYFAESRGPHTGGDGPKPAQTLSGKGRVRWAVLRAGWCGQRRGWTFNTMLQNTKGRARVLK